MSRSRRADVETAELARRRLPDVLSGSSGAARPSRAAPENGLGAPDDLDELDLLDVDLLDDDLTGTGDPGRRGPGRTSDGLVQRVRTFTRGHLGVVLVVVVLALLVAAAGVARARPMTLAEPALVPVGAGSSPVGGPSAAVTATPTPAAPTASTTPGPVVHVIGAVRRPGVVHLAVGARVADALTAAGGLAADADPGDLNLAQVVLDGQQVVVVDREAARRDPPAVSAVRGPGTFGSSAAPGSSGGSGGTAGSSAGASAGASTGAKIDLNTATAEQLDGLSGVGPVTAQRILDWRSAHGRFSRIEELQEVDGIGPKTFAELAPQVTV